MKLHNKKTGETMEGLELSVIEYGFGHEWMRDWSYNSIKAFLEDWEDVKENSTAEPLIKDEKIRKAVRAWAELVGKEETFVVTYNAEYHDCCIYTAGLSNTAMIDLGIDLNISEGSYTITELCGEE